MEYIERFYLKIMGDKPLHRILSVVTVACFPLVLVLLVESLHVSGPAAFLAFLLDAPGVFIFDLLLVGGLLGILALLVRHLWLAMFIEGATFYTLALVEYFKFEANGTHFSLADLVMAGKLSDVARFANLELQGEMVLAFAILILYVLWASFLKIKLHMRPMRCVCTGLGAVALMAVLLGVPQVYQSIYGMFGVDYTPSYSPYGSNERFRSNRQIAFLSQNLSKQISKAFAMPKGYSEEAVEAILPTRTKSTKKDETLPDIIIIMSEAYADFRTFEGLPVPANTYRNFDRLAQEGGSGTALVPTFGGYTCKTEFELLFGLPIKGIEDENIPHQLFTDGEPRPTFAAYLQGLGYRTQFIHPFSSSFYNRDKAYQSYGFDQLLFEDDLQVSPTRLGDYIDDDTLVRQIQYGLDNGDGQPQFIFAVSMQNHGPYAADDAQYAVPDSRLTASEQAELGRYFHGVRQTDAALGKLTNYLRTRTRPTVLLFVGDHYPYLGRQGAMYQKFGDVSGYRLYEQSYLLWSNTDTPYTLPQTDVSAFYLPHVVADRIGLPKDRFFTDMWQMLQTTPLYSFDLGNNSPDAHALTTLSFDRTQGMYFSSDKNAPPSGFSLKLLFSNLASNRITPIGKMSGARE